ncbi:serine/threonine protein kinase [Paenibacillus marchantiophytorum]|uniref:Serine/threonine protein kinase n=1 Tax=Paenibacillus marchantiophytorum TaxID=1619310 RepID=A0ABQ1FHG6_9BACL|nr:PhoP regulatory network YrbL family protein [Paenibacillus marchantiophytorum]GGA13478.1 serine/threonine protein kinase [Paenibacillus marchantiophytorum]
MLKPWLIDIQHQLLPNLEIHSEDPFEPIVVHVYPKPWKLVGAGNYAAVFMHPNYPDMVVKVYAPGRHGIVEETEVYSRLGKHPAFSECYHAGDNFLVLRRLTGVTLYNCLQRGLPIPRQVIADIDLALAYAVSRGLNPHDVHGKNVMMQDGRGLVVDVSDFMKSEYCPMWDDLKQAYDRFYYSWIRRLRIPGFALNVVRRGYRKWKKFRRSRHTIQSIK